MLPIETLMGEGSFRQKPGRYEYDKNKLTWIIEEAVDPDKKIIHIATYTPK